MLGRERTTVEGRNEGNVLYGEKSQFIDSKAVQKNWRLVVVIYRSSSKETWEGIRDGLCRRLRRFVDLSIYMQTKQFYGVGMKRRKENCSVLNFAI